MLNNPFLRISLFRMLQSMIFYSRIMGQNVSVSSNCRWKYQVLIATLERLFVLRFYAVAAWMKNFKYIFLKPGNTAIKNTLALP